MSNSTATALLAEWDQKDAEQRERLAHDGKAMDLLCIVNEQLLANGAEAMRTMPEVLLEIVHVAAIERLSMLTLSVLNKVEK